VGSEWVITEWGAAWALQKKIVPMLHRIDIPQVPVRLAGLQCVDAAEVNDHIEERFSSSRTDAPA